MFLCGYQLERRAEEAARPRGDRAALGPPPEPARLLEEARDVYERLLRASSLADGPVWIGRALLSLGRLEARAGRTAEAGEWLERIAGADLALLGRRLLPDEREELEALARMAAFTRADLARNAGDLATAARRYAEAIERHAGAPLVLWGRFQLGSLYERQGLHEEAAREYSRGKALLEGPLRAAPPGPWLGADRKRLADLAREVLPGGQSASVEAALLGSAAPGGDRRFWERLFEMKLRAIALSE